MFIGNSDWKFHFCIIYCLLGVIINVVREPLLKMSAYSDSQSEDGELARSPVTAVVREPQAREDLDFSLSDEDREHDSLDIKPPQAVIRPSHRERRAHKRPKDRHKESLRREKKNYREKDIKSEKVKRDPNVKAGDRDLDSTKDYYREKVYYREKDAFREKEFTREKEIQRGREIYREKESGIRDKELLREKEAYREREQYRERELYRDNTSYREKDINRQKESFKEKDTHKDKDLQREREAYLGRERTRYPEQERRRDVERTENSRTRSVTDEQSYNEKENRDRSSGEKELEDLRSRLLSKRITKELQSHESRKRHPQSEKDESRRHRDNSESSLDKSQQERRQRLLEAEREMEKRKQSSRTELEKRREQRRRRGAKRSVTPVEPETNNKKSRVQSEQQDDAVVTVSDSSDVEMKSESHSDQEEGEHSQSESEEESSNSESESDSDSRSEGNEEVKEEEKKEKPVADKKEAPRERSKSPEHHSSSHSERQRSHTRSRSRSHSFSPPPQNKNGTTDNLQEKEHDSEEEKLMNEKLDLLPPYFPALQGCRSVEEFQCLNRIEEGTYGVVYRARDKTTEEIVALKRLKMEKEKEGFPITSLREINTLLKGQHPNIVTVREIVVGSNMDKIFIVMDYVEHDLKSLMETMRGKKQVFLPGEVKCLMMQLLQAVHHLHDNWILHRDLKTSNLLLSHKGILKVGDFGLAREYGSPLRQYTPIVVTLWYRSPELLLCCKEYSTPIDMWSVGCIFAEFVTMNPLFPGKSEVDQLNKIFKDLGTPSEAIWPGYSKLPAVQKMTFAEHPAGGLRQRAGPDLLSDLGLSLLQSFLTYNPARRITAEDALEHPYFKEQPVAIDPAMFPTWPAKSEGGRRTTHSPRPPAGGAAYAQFARADDEALGFHISNAPPPSAPQQRSLHVAPGFSLKF